MQDKDFDKLFNQKFEDFEVEPSPALWDNIADELDGKKTNRAIMPWLSIAATVLVVVTAGVLFLQKDDTGNQPTKENKVAVSDVKSTSPVKNEAEPIEETKIAVAAKTTKIAKQIAPVGKHDDDSVAVAAQIFKVTPADIIDNEPTVSNQPIIAAVVNATAVTPRATLPDVPLTARALDTDTQGTTTDIEVVVSEEKQISEPVKKRGIRNMGGLINALVAKIDKRENKLIEFSDGDGDDDNGTTVTGVNLGLIKIKKQ